MITSMLFVRGFLEEPRPPGSSIVRVTSMLDVYTNLWIGSVTPGLNLEIGLDDGVTATSLQDGELGGLGFV